MIYVKNIVKDTMTSHVSLKDAETYVKRIWPQCIVDGKKEEFENKIKLTSQVNTLYVYDFGENLVAYIMKDNK